MLADLTTDAELSGFLNAALDSLDRLREAGDVSLPETPTERLELYEEHSDPIKEYRLTYLEEYPDSTLSKEAVYNAYKRFCEATGRTVTARNTFFGELRKTTLAYVETRPGSGDDRPRSLQGVGFTATGAEYAVDHGDGDADIDAPLSPGEIDTDATDAGGRLPAVVGTVTAAYEDRYGNPAGRLEGPNGDGIDFTLVGDLSTLPEGEAYRLDGAKLTIDELGALEIEIDPATGVETVAGEGEGDDGTGPTRATTDGGTAGREAGGVGAPPAPRD